MALDQKARDVRRRGKAAALQEEDLRLKVRPGTKQALAELMKWAGIEEQGEAMTLMIHHLHALGRDFLLRLLAPQNATCDFVAPTEVLRLGARRRTTECLGCLAEWAGLEAGAIMDRVIHAVRALELRHAVKFLTPPKHVVRLSTRLVLDFDRKSMLMIQQDSGDEVISPS